MNMKVFNKTLNGLLKNKMVLYGLVAAVVALLVIGGLVLMKKRKMHEGFQDENNTYPDTPENSLENESTTDTSMESNTTEPSMELNTTEPSMELNTTDPSMEPTTINPESPTIEQCSQMGCYGPK